MNTKIERNHLDRQAAVYLRQSTIKQVHEHRESTERQYALTERAKELGWGAERVEVIDEDLGQSGTSIQRRNGLQRLAEDIAHGRVGAIFALEVSRLARSSADWHRLLDLCGLADVVIVDEQAVYTPRDFNDRLRLGLKGTMSEAELYWMRRRLQGGKLNKARRGELFFTPPAGSEWDAATLRFRLDPDEQVQRAVRLVFERFRLDASAYGVSRYFADHGLPLPARSIKPRALRWVPPRQTLILTMLHNPSTLGPMPSVEARAARASSTARCASRFAGSLRRPGARASTTSTRRTLAGTSSWPTRRSCTTTTSSTPPRTDRARPVRARVCFRGCCSVVVAVTA